MGGVRPLKDPPCSEEGTQPQHDATPVLEAQIAGLKEVADLLRAQLEDVREDRDRWREQAAVVARQLPDQRQRKRWRRLRP
jgi:hypothetical protein